MPLNRPAIPVEPPPDLPQRQAQPSERVRRHVHVRAGRVARERRRPPSSLKRPWRPRPRVSAPWSSSSGPGSSVAAAYQSCASSKRPGASTAAESAEPPAGTSQPTNSASRAERRSLPRVAKRPPSRTYSVGTGEEARPRLPGITAKRALVFDPVAMQKVLRAFCLVIVDFMEVSPETFSQTGSATSSMRSFETILKNSSEVAVTTTAPLTRSSPTRSWVRTAAILAADTAQHGRQGHAGRRPLDPLSGRAGRTHGEASR